MFTEVLEQIRQEARMTQPQMAHKLGMAVRTYRDYIYNVRTMHPALQCHIAYVLKSARLSLMALGQFAVNNPFAPALLEVDTHPATQLCVSMRELREAQDSVLAIDASKAQAQDVERAIDQMMDLLHLIPVAIISWCERYGVDPWACRRRNVGKLAARGYLRKEEVAA